MPKTPPLSNRRLQILQALALLLQQPYQEKVTTAALAAQLGLSEAALYRHFTSKAEMFVGLIQFTEHTIFSLINQIAEEEEQGAQQARQIGIMLMKFSEKNPGLTRVLIGEALVNESAELQTRVNRLIERVEASFRQSLRIAISQNFYENSFDSRVRAHLLVSCILGEWHRYVKSGFQTISKGMWIAQINLLLTA